MYITEIENCGEPQYNCFQNLKDAAADALLYDGILYKDGTAPECIMEFDRQAGEFMPPKADDAVEGCSIRNISLRITEPERLIYKLKQAGAWTEAGGIKKALCWLGIKVTHIDDNGNLYVRSLCCSPGKYYSVRWHMLSGCLTGRAEWYGPDGSAWRDIFYGGSMQHEEGRIVWETEQTGIWIPVEKKMPPNDAWVLVHLKLEPDGREHITEGYYLEDDGEWRVALNGGYNAKLYVPLPYEVMHWMPMPEDPEKRR